MALTALLFGTDAAHAQDEPAADAVPPRAGQAATPGQGGAGQGGGTYIAAPGWIVNLGVTGSGSYSSSSGAGGGGGGGQRRSSIILTVTPSLDISGDTPRTQMNFSYQPSLSYHVTDGGRTSIGHNMRGRIHAMVLEDRMYVDAFAYAAYVPQYGGYAFTQPTTTPPPVGTPPPNNFIGLPRETMTQVYSFGVTPSFIQRFGGFGYAQASASYLMTSTTRPSFENTQNGFQQVSSAGTTSTLQQSASFTSGEDWGRFQDIAQVVTSQVQGTGASSGASTMSARNSLSYAATRWATVIGTIGYQQSKYPNARVVRGNSTPTETDRRGYTQDGIIWNGSIRVIPNAESQITVGYGRAYGGEQLSADAYYMVTARTSLSMRYYTSLGTNQQQLQNDLQGGIGPGAPPPPPGPIGPGYITGNQNIYRSNTLSVSASTNWDVDSVSLTASYSNQRLVATTIIDDSLPNPNPPLDLSNNSSSRSLSLTGSWTHQFSDVMNGSLQGTYGIRRATSVEGSTDHFMTANASLRYIFSPSLSGAANYYFYDLKSQTPNRSFTQNVITLSVSKQF